MRKGLSAKQSEGCALFYSVISRVGFLVAARVWGASSGHCLLYFSSPGQPLPLTPAATHKPWPGAGPRVAGIYQDYLVMS